MRVVLPLLEEDLLGDVVGAARRGLRAIGHELVECGVDVGVALRARQDVRTGVRGGVVADLLEQRGGRFGGGLGDIVPRDEHGDEVDAGRLGLRRGVAGGEDAHQSVGEGAGFRPATVLGDRGHAIPLCLSPLGTVLCQVAFIIVPLLSHCQRKSLVIHIFL